MKEKERQDARRKYEQAIKKLLDSGLKVTNLADKGIKSIGFIGGVRHPRSVPIPAKDEDDADYPRKPVN
jgi:hypothetical protein